MEFLWFGIPSRYEQHHSARARNLALERCLSQLSWMFSLRSGRTHCTAAIRLGEQVTCRVSLCVADLFSNFRIMCWARLFIDVCSKCLRSSTATLLQHANVPEDSWNISTSGKPNNDFSQFKITAFNGTENLLQGGGRTARKHRCAQALAIRRSLPRCLASVLQNFSFTELFNAISITAVVPGTCRIMKKNPNQNVDPNCPTSVESSLSLQILCVSEFWFGRL